MGLLRLLLEEDKEAEKKKEAENIWFCLIWEELWLNTQV